ncbi:hypothetical protein [Butyrivibrio sp. YAB3001]|uniref:hypothetical protein n=1 Tax=Butyrivibrio sp. YAB3001 TaxID=1520812 RepID=UPI0008F65D15|nr:hypothetical protein [Butyrivibrio sp. YAB3001]SFD03861.1 hypothetical protein SAMN02910398_03860 [Butyrivibrio sp. YAB3001]
MINGAGTKVNRALAGIMVVMVLFVVLFSAIFIVSHVDHDCTGENCPICACIQQCENILHGAGGSTLFAVVAFVPVFLIFGSYIISYCIVFSDTLVSAKVRMNN